tara:strand:- start:1342 stop:1965 length:624 start_codon:yes stop_codon:yes gene_type:complete
MATIKGLHAKLIVEKLKSVFNKKKYAFFDNNKTYNVNVIGCRSNQTKANEFDDCLFLIYRGDDKDWIVHSYQLTTDIGIRYLKTPINKDGAAILVPGQYMGVYKIAKHRGKYDALCQKNGKVKVWRDDDRDKTLDMDDSTIQEGYYGINIHRAAATGEMEYVNGYSAGCQVFKAAKDFNEFMALIKLSAKKYDNKFSYTLIEEEDLK